MIELEVGDGFGVRDKGRGRVKANSGSRSGERASSRPYI